MKRFVFPVFFCVFFLCFAGCSLEKSGDMTDIVYLDLSSLNGTDMKNQAEVLALWDVMHSVASLQGIVNRDGPRLYVDYVVTDGQSVDKYWWDMFSSPGEWLSCRSVTRTSDPLEVMDMYRKSVRGLVVYDSEIASTSNVASTVAGVENLIAVRYDNTEGSMYRKLLDLGFKVKVWLVNKDGSSKFSSKLEPYRWAIDNYLSKGLCSSTYAAYYIDQYWRERCLSSVSNHHQLSNHDFFIKEKAFFFDLSPWGDEPATDDAEGKPGEDKKILEEILLTIYQQNGGKEFCHIGGFPAWAYKYTDWHDVGGKHGPVETEWEFARIISAYNAFKDADAIGYGALANASFWSFYPLDENYAQQWVTRESLKKKGYLDSDGKLDMSRKYLLFYVGDYDASAWLYQTMPSLWNDKERGSVPLMWSISPVLARRVPMVMDHLRKTATPNDYFAAADNGAGYLNPGMLEEPRAESGLPSGLEAWTEHCRKWYDRWGLSISGFVIDGFAPGLTDAGFSAYSRFSPNGMVIQKTPSRAFLCDGMPVLRSGIDIVSANPVDAEAELLPDLQLHPECPFYWYRAILKSPSWYASLMSELEKDSPSTVWLSAPEFFELLRCYLEEK